MGYLEKELTGWGRYPRSVARVYRPDKAGQIDAILGSEPDGILARGRGRSYGDAALNSNGGVLLTERLDRFLDFDPETGRLTCEAGVGLDEILRVCLPRGWFLPVTPGTKFVSIGGAVACDVHGKNHHRHGSLGRHLDWLELRLADGSVVRCSPDENADLFRATVGGLGLTGIILAVRLRMRRVETAYLAVDYYRSRQLEETMRLLEEEDDRYTYSVAWVDCLASGKNLGRSVLIRGDHCPLSELPERCRSRPLEVRDRKLGALPFEMPGFLLNRFSIRCLNGFYYRRFREGRSTRIEHYAPFFYPLDVLHHWNRAYGRRGFLQYQCCFPGETSADAMQAILERVSSSGQGSFLAVLKRFGDEDAGFLSFPRPGYTLALDFPMRGEPVLALLEELDGMVLRWGGRVYLAKDARLSRENFERMYPDLDEWREIRRRVDPEGRFSSDLARRLGLSG